MKTAAIKQTATHWAMGLTLVAGLALAGSDGEWFPWANLGGVALFCAFALAGRRMEERQ